MIREDETLNQSQHIIMNRYIPFIVIGGLLYLVFSNCTVSILTWKDSDNLERIVITPKKSEQKSDIPAIPAGISDKDERFEKGEGPFALGAYAVKSVIKMIPKDQKAGEEEKKSETAGTNSSVHFPRRHTVGKVAEGEVLPPALPPDDGGNTAFSRVSLSGSQETAGNATSSKTQKNRAGADIDENDYANPAVKRVHSFDDAILVASFNVDPWWEEDSRNSPELAHELASILVQFDLVAVQGFRINDSKFLDGLMEDLSRISAGKKFAYAAALAGGLQVSKNDPALVFIYDTTTMEVDAHSVSYLGTPRQPFKYRPLAASFRTRKTSVDKAFTFTAVNVYLATSREKEEFAQIPNIINAAKGIHAKPGAAAEDDILIMGHFGVEPTDKLPDYFPRTFTWSAYGRATNAWGTFQSTTENICYMKDATVEGEYGGVWCLKSFFQRKNGIPFDYHPVWMKFSIYEGGKKTAEAVP